jgi:hypothetical protein
MLRNFVGYKGKMAAATIGRIQFVILAKNEKQLAILWAEIVKSTSFDSSLVDSAILIRANILPGKKAPRKELPTAPYVEV